MSSLRDSIQRKLRSLAPLPLWLNWLLSVVEPLVVLGITVAILYVGFGLVFGSAQSTNQARFKELMAIVSDNWKAALLILLVLFYRTVRMFLEEVEEAFGMKRKKPMSGEPEKASNPPQENRS